MSKASEQVERNRHVSSQIRPSSSPDRSGDRQDAGLAMPPRKVWLTFLIILLINYIVMRLLLPGPDAAIIVPYTTFKQQAANGNVESIYSKGASVEGRFHKAVTWPPNTKRNLRTRRTRDCQRSCARRRSPAVQMVTRWGMSDKLGMVQLAPRENRFLGGEFGGTKPFSEETARVIDAEVQKIIRDSHEQAKSLLIKHRKQLDALVEALLARETLDEREILDVTGLPPAPALESGRIAAAVHG